MSIISLGYQLTKGGSVKKSIFSSSLKIILLLYTDKYVWKPEECDCWSCHSRHFWALASAFHHSLPDGIGVVFHPKFLQTNVRNYDFTDLGLHSWALLYDISLYIYHKLLLLYSKTVLPNLIGLWPFKSKIKAILRVHLFSCFGPFL